jgi:hypothetical protein
MQDITTFTSDLVTCHLLDKFELALLSDMYKYLQVNTENKIKLSYSIILQYYHGLNIC